VPLASAPRYATVPLQHASGIPPTTFEHLVASFMKISIAPNVFAGRFLSNVPTPRVRAPFRSDVPPFVAYTGSGSQLARYTSSVVHAENGTNFCEKKNYSPCSVL